MTDYVDIKGYLSWAKVYPDHYDTYNGEDRWQITLTFFNEEEFDKYKALGLGLWVTDKNKVKHKDINEVQYEDGLSVNVRRGFKKYNKKSGEVMEFEAPRVTKWDDESESYVPFTEAIGNGSTGKVNLEVFGTGEYKGHRLSGVTILDHVPYEAKEPSTVSEPEDKGDAKPW